MAGEQQMPRDQKSVTWPGELADPSVLSASVVEIGHALADAAASGAWEHVFALLDGGDVLGGANAWRPGGTAWFTPLHQAAWHGAGDGVITELLARGAWRTLPDAQGRTSAMIARERGHRDLLDLLEPAPLRTVDPNVLPVLERHLQALIESRIWPQLTVTLRYPVAAVLTELPPGTDMWFAVPGMYGGFNIELRDSYLFVSSWSRTVGGSGQSHVITTEGPVLVEEGFV